MFVGFGKVLFFLFRRFFLGRDTREMDGLEKEEVVLKDGDFGVSMIDFEGVNVGTVLTIKVVHKLLNNHEHARLGSGFERFLLE